VVCPLRRKPETSVPQPLDAPPEHGGDLGFELFIPQGKAAIGGRANFVELDRIQLISERTPVGGGALLGGIPEPEVFCREIGSD